MQPPWRIEPAWGILRSERWLLGRERRLRWRRGTRCEGPFGIIRARIRRWLHGGGCRGQLGPFRSCHGLRGCLWRAHQLPAEGHWVKDALDVDLVPEGEHDEH